MSSLQTPSQDDFVDAATKNLRDAEALLGARRWDGAGYHAGYAVECSVKALLLVELLATHCGGLAGVATRGRQLLTAAAAPVPKWLTQLRNRPFGHRLEMLRTTAKGQANPLIVPRYVTKYVPRALAGPTPSGLFRDWSESLRYRAPGAVQAKVARRWGETARRVVQGSIDRMILDGVVAR